jgi:hypothetical protein
MKRTTTHLIAAFIFASVWSSSAEDARLKPLKDLDGYFPFTVPASVAEWEKRAEALRMQIRVAVGLFPEPDRTPLNAVIHGRMDFDGYSVEKVYFESMPGFFVTGNLFRPANLKEGQKVPGVLCPHGHFPEGRFGFESDASIANSIEQGAEKFEGNARNVKQARCVQLARMGCTTFLVDMIGYADSQQLSFDLAHRFAKQRAEMVSPDSWGLFSPQAESWLQSIMGLQTWSAMRSLDFLETLPEVDTKRLAVTGGSGGGTQTMLLSALDPRVAVSFPAVMVSTAMQGGCTCENASLLRIGAGNVDFAALFAPKPLGMTAADDWTKEMETKGFPELQQLYTLLGKPDNVHLTARLEFGHNYNSVSRHAMYHWMNKHLQLGLEEPIVEQASSYLPREKSTAWDDAHPRPEGGADFERRLLQQWRKAVEEKMDDATARKGFGVIFGRGFSSAGESNGEVDWKKTERNGYMELEGTLTNTTYSEEVAVRFLYPKDWKGGVVVCLSDKEDDVIHQLVEQGKAVCLVDRFEQETRTVKNPRESAAYTHGYNDSIFVRRVHDLLTVIRYISQDDHGPKSIDLVAMPGFGPEAAAARLQAGNALRKCAIFTEGFRFQNVKSLNHDRFLPGAAHFGDLPMMLKLGGDEKNLLLDERSAEAVLKWLAL